jgi:hypothetical protein
MRAIRSRQMFNESDTLVQPASIAFGSLRPSQFISDLAAGRDSLDIVVVGDSNTGSALADMWGYHHGLQQALFNRGYTCYATPVCPVVTGFTANPAVASPNIWRGAVNMESGGNAGNSPLLDGNTSGGSTPYAAWNPGTTWTRYGSSTSVPPYMESWAYLANSTQYFSTNGVGLDIGHPLNTNGNVLRYRVRYGRFVGSGGYICPIVLNIVSPSPTIATSKAAFSALSVSGGVDPIAAEVSWTANGTNAYRGGWGYTGPDGSGIVTKGPVAVHSHSMYRATKGWAVTSHGYQGGETSTQIATKMDTVKGAPLREHLTELRARQIAAGGTGRVLVMVQSGTNGTDTAATWVAAHKTIWASYRTAWATLGYPPNDLAIVSWVSHPLDANDSSSTGASIGNLQACRVASQQMALDNPDMCVVNVKALASYEQLLWAGGNGTTYYQRYNNIPAAGANIVAHLSGGYYSGTTFGPSDGYTMLSNAILGVLLASA